MDGTLSFTSERSNRDESSMEEGAESRAGRGAPLPEEKGATMLSEKELQEMKDLEDYVHFRAGLVEESPEGFNIDEL